MNKTRGTIASDIADEDYASDVGDFSHLKQLLTLTA